MIEFLNQDWIGSLLGLLGLSIGVIGLIFYRNSKIGPRPTCLLKSLTLISKEKQELPKEVDILYKKQSVPRVSLSKIYFWNSGRETIQGEQVVEKDALRIEFEPQDQILKAHIATRTREVNQTTILTDNENSHVAKIAFDYLDPGDGVRIDILHTSELHIPKVKGSIRGVPKGISVSSALRPSPFDRALNDILKRKNVFLWTTAILGVIILLLGTLPQSLLVAIKNLFKSKETGQGDPILIMRTAFITIGVLYSFMPISILLKRRKQYPDCLDNEA